MNDKPRSWAALRRRSVEAVTHFVALIHARERGDAAKVTDATRELVRLGCRVRFIERQPKEVPHGRR